MKQIKGIGRLVLVILLMGVALVPGMVMQKLFIEKYVDIAGNLWWKIVTRFGLIKTKN